MSLNKLEIRNILVLCEMSDSDHLLFKGVCSLASNIRDCHVYLTHVAAPNPGFVGYDAGPQHERNMRAEMLHKEHAQLQEWADNLRSDGNDSTAIMLQGPTVEKILEEIERLHVDLVIIGRHRHGNLYRILSGSTSEEVIQKAQCPVLLFPLES